MIFRPSPLITDLQLTLTQVGTVVIGDPTPVITRKSLKSITYDESYVASTQTLPIYSVDPIPSRVTIVNDGGAKSVRAYFDGSAIHTTSPGAIICNFEFTLTGGQRYNVVRRLDTAVETTQYYLRELVLYNAGSLAKHIWDTAELFKNGDPLIRRSLFLTYDQTNLMFGRNVSCFLHDVYGIESYPASNSSGAHRMNGIAISRRHYLSVQHIGSQLGQTIYFVRRDNTLISRNIIDYVQLRGSSDQTVAVFDEQLPADFEFPQILVGGFSYLPEYASDNVGTLDICVPSLRLLPIVVFNQDYRPAINFMSNMWTTSFGFTYFVYSPNALDTLTPTPWQQKIRGGDSGSPTCLVINNRLVVLGSASIIYGGINIGENQTDVQAAMDFLCDKYSFPTETLSVANLSSFTNYA